MRSKILLVAAVLLAAGCMTSPAATEDVAPAAAGNVTIDDARPEPTFNDLALKAALPDAQATLLRAPEWKVGEWWKYHFSSPLTGEEVEFIKVVADIDGDTYVIGMPHEGWYKEAIVYHTPCLGDVRVSDLGCAAHNIDFQPLQFPLTDGATWVTQFERPPDLTATVKVDSLTQATITFTDPNGNVQVEQVYDATIHEVVSFTQATAVYEVIEHGYDFEGWITIPRGVHLVFEHGRVVAPVVDIAALGGGTPVGAPTESIEVTGGFNRLSFILAAGNAGVAPAEAGYYKETATAPDGTVFSLEATGTSPLVIEFFEAKDPDGTWDLEHLAAGPGIAFIEGIAYHQYDIQLPSGAIRSDHSHEVVR